MVKFKPGEELILKLGKEFDTDQKNERYVLARLSTLGIKVRSVERDIDLNPPSLYEFALQTPITSENSYLGIEHFSLMTLVRGLNTRTTTRLFNRIIDPSGEVSNAVKNNQSPVWGASQTKKIREFYELHEIDVTSRIAAKLPEIPSYLSRFDSPCTDQMAVRADSVLKIAKNQDKFKKLVPGFGESALRGVGVVSDYISQEISRNKDVNSG